MARERIPAHLQTSRGVMLEKDRLGKGKEGILRDLVSGVRGEGEEESEYEHLSGGQRWLVVVFAGVGLIGDG